MALVVHTATLMFALALGVAAWAEDFGGQGPLLFVPSDSLDTILPADTHIMADPDIIEAFLVALDETPPDWAAVYGNGHHDSLYDDRLFALNRERDVKREGRAELSWRLSFAWVGELSPYRDEIGGFPVALGMTQK